MGSNPNSIQQLGQRQYFDLAAWGSNPNSPYKSTEKVGDI
jgi:hypothetical protein